MTDDELMLAVDEQARILTPRVAMFVRRYFTGASVLEAAVAAGASPTTRAPHRFLKRAGAMRYLELLREQARRAAMFTAAQAVQEFRDIAEEARAAGDFGAAVKGVKEAATICNLYPTANVALVQRHRPDAGCGPATDAGAPEPAVVARRERPRPRCPPPTRWSRWPPLASPPAGSGESDEEPESTEKETNTSRMDAAMAAFKSRRDTPRAVR